MCYGHHHDLHVLTHSFPTRRPSERDRPQAAGALASQLREFEHLRDFFTSSTLTALVDLPFLFLFVFVVYLVGGKVAIVPLTAIPIVVIVGIVVQIPLK